MTEKKTAQAAATSPPENIPAGARVGGVGEASPKGKNFCCVYSEEERKKKIRKEAKRLEKIFENVDIIERNIAKNLINDAAFMYVTLEETKQIINRDGVIEEYQNGEHQRGRKKSSAVEVYDKMINTYSKVIKQLCDMIPGNERDDIAEDILAFAQRNG